MTLDELYQQTPEGLHGNIAVNYSQNVITAFDGKDTTTEYSLGESVIVRDEQGNERKVQEVKPVAILKMSKGKLVRTEIVE